MGKIPKYTDSERLMTPKTEYLLTDKEGEKSISMDFQVCQPQKTRVLCHLEVLHYKWLKRFVCTNFVPFFINGQSQYQVYSSMSFTLTLWIV